MITLISVKRVRGRADLTLSDGETLHMPRAMLRERPYRVGTPFDRAQFDAFLEQRAAAYALQYAVTLLSSRDRTEREIVEGLRQNAYPERAVARTIARLHESGYLNDADFARRWASARAAKGMGTRRIQAELRMKGVDPAQIDAALAGMDEADAFEAAVRSAEKAARGKDLHDPADYRKAWAALARRGYDFSTAKRALQRVAESE